MPVQNYSINTRNAVAGQLYGLQQTRADIQTRMAGEVLDFGVGIADAAATDSRAVTAATGGKVAITLRQINREQETRPGDGNVKFKVGEALPALFDGRVVVHVADGAAGTKGALLHCTAGVFQVDSGTPANATTNVRLDVVVDAANNLYAVVVTE